MMTTEEAPKAESTSDDALFEASVAALERQEEKGSFLSKRSYLCGWIDLYAPEGDSSTWSTLPWTLKIDNDPETMEAATYKLAAAHAFEGFNHVGLVYHRPDWLFKALPLTPLVPLTGA